MSIYWPAQTPDSMRRAAAALGAVGNTTAEQAAFEVGIKELAKGSGASEADLLRYGDKYQWPWDRRGVFGITLPEFNKSKSNTGRLVDGIKVLFTFSDAQRIWGQSFARWTDSAGAPKGTFSALQRAWETREGQGSAQPPALGIIGAIRVVFLIIPALERALGRRPTEAEIDAIASDFSIYRASDINNKVAAMSRGLEEKFQGVTDEAKKALATAKKVQDAADAIRKEVNAVLKKIGLPETPVQGWLEPGQARVNKSSSINVAIPGGMSLRTVGLNGMRRGAHTNLKLAGLGLGASTRNKRYAGKTAKEPVDDSMAFGLDKRDLPAKDVSKKESSGKQDLVSLLDSKSAAALADEAAGNAQLTADKALAAYVATKAAGDVPAAKQAAALADAALVEIKTHQLAARAANAQAERAFAAETKAAADAKKAQLDAQAAADKAAADKLAADRKAYLEAQKTFYMTLDKNGLKSEYLKIKDSGETDIIATLIEVARTRGLDLLKAAVPYAAIAAAGAIGILLYMRSKKAAA